MAKVPQHTEDFSTHFSGFLDHGIKTEDKELLWLKYWHNTSSKLGTEGEGGNKRLLVFRNVIIKSIFQTKTTLNRVLFFP